MIAQDGTGKEIAKAVAIAALSSLATSLVTWVIDEVKERVAKTDEPKKKGHAR